MPTQKAVLIRLSDRFRSLSVSVLAPVVIVGALVTALVVGMGSLPLRQYFENAAAADLGLVTELAIRECEANFDELLALRLSENQAMVETFRRECLNEVLSVARWFTDVEVAVVENQQTIVASSDPSVNESEAILGLPVGDSEAPVSLPVDGGALAMWRYFPLWRWTIVAYRLEASLLMPLRRAQYSVLIAALGTTASFIVAFVLVFHHLVTRRLREIATAAEQVSEGAYPHLKTLRADQIGRVASAFNLMAQSINDKDRAAEDAFRRIAESEARFRQIIETSSAGYFLFDRDGRLRQVNDAFVNLQQIHDAPIGRTFASLFRDDGRRAEEYVGVILGGGAVDSGELLLHDRENTTQTMTFSAVPVREQGKVVGGEGFMIDTTRQKRAELELRESLREKELLLQEVHHRVRNNLSVVVSLLRLQAAGLPQDDPSAGAFQDAQSRIMSMAQVHSLLYESGVLRSLRVDQYVGRIAHEIISWASSERTIELIQDTEPWEVGLDHAVPLGLLINEAVTNAVKHAFEGVENPVISIAYHRRGDSDELSIRDNGIGIPAKELRRQGSLGMTLIEELAQQLGGRVEIRVASGTEVLVRFPVT